MKTTLELPDNLLERVKILAIQEKRRFKDMMAEVVEIGLRNRNRNAGTAYRLPKPIKLKGGYRPTAEEIIEIIHRGRE